MIPFPLQRCRFHSRASRAVTIDRKNRCGASTKTTKFDVNIGDNVRLQIFPRKYPNSKCSSNKSIVSRFKSWYNYIQLTSESYFYISILRFCLANKKKIRNVSRKWLIIKLDQKIDVLIRICMC